MNKYVGCLYISEPEPGAGGGGSDHSFLRFSQETYVYYLAAMTPDYHHQSTLYIKLRANFFPGSAARLPDRVCLRRQIKTGKNRGHNLYFLIIFEEKKGASRWCLLFSLPFPERNRKKTGTQSIFLFFSMAQARLFLIEPLPYFYN
jgi:hypothetical protein